MPPLIPTTTPWALASVTCSLIHETSCSVKRCMDDSWTKMRAFVQSSIAIADATSQNIVQEKGIVLTMVKTCASLTQEKAGISHTWGD